MAKTRAQENKSIRQESLREFLAAKCTVQHVIDNIIKIEELDPYDPDFKSHLDKWKTSSDLRLKLINKYLPELKAQEVEHSADAELVKAIERRIVDTTN